ncbi:DNA repair protein [Cryptosporidium ryanae]|uniref:DNA repair protein n=1 Tax=Cryptosporidium ryanae TaxID=515981 RepID=UPI00351A4147|nr:DNA repair protein [Cryptosporidium ryanae]
MDKKGKQTGNLVKNDKQSSILSFFSPKVNNKKEVDSRTTPVKTKNTKQVYEALIDQDNDTETELFNYEENENRVANTEISILKELDNFSAERIKTCDSTPCKMSSKKKSDTPLNETMGRRIRRISDSDDEDENKDLDIELPNKRVKRRLQDDNTQSTTEKDYNLVEFKYSMEDGINYLDMDEETGINIEKENIRNIGIKLPLTRHSIATKYQEIDDLTVNEEEEFAKRLLGTVAAQSSQLFRDYIDAILQYGRNYSFPSWLLLKNIRDGNGTSPFDPTYDPSTIWVPNSYSKVAKEEKIHFTPAMEQYWEFKREHFDKILFFKMGKFYEMFYIDACICQKHCDLRWTAGDAKPHVGFPETALHAYANKLVNLGYRVVVVEQMETPKELEERNRSASRGVKKEKAVKRDINEVLTNGTLVRPDMLSDMASILMTIYFDRKENENNELIYEVGIVCVDITTGKVELTSVEEKGDQFLMIRTIISQVQPKEIAYLPGNIPIQVLRYLSSITPSIQLTNFRDFVDSLLAINDIVNTFNRLEIPLPEIVDQLCNKSKSLCCAFSGTLRYLSTILLCDRLIMTGTFSEYDPSKTNHLMLNVGAIKDLELLQTQHGDEGNSLFGFLKHTITPGGSRLLKKWITYPLTNIDRINERLDSVSWFMENSEKLYEFREELRKLDSSLNSSSNSSVNVNGSGISNTGGGANGNNNHGSGQKNSRRRYSQNLDFERLINRITSGVLQSKRGAVFFTNVIQKRIQEFINSMDLFDSTLKCIIDIFGNSETRRTMPKLLLALTGLRKEDVNNDKTQVDESFCDGYLTNIFETTRKLRSLVVLDNNTGDWKPVPGKCREYDEIVDSINNIKKSLNDELLRISKEMNTTSISFVNNKYRYEIECPESIPKSRFPDSAEITSSKKGYVRFHTDEIKQLLYDLEFKEEQLQKSLFPYLQTICKEFHRNFSSFSAISDSVSQLDVLISLALTSMDTSEGPFCRPNFINKSENNGAPFLEFKECRHPVIARLKTNYIPNDVFLNSNGNNACCCLVTGPNMGGKSTILRQTCIIVIIAHIGCYVPASECNLTPVDKIFTRIGAYDSIIEGKSTFLVELEETAEILNHSTQDSLVIIDELGRGTSTFDGTAISIATLEYISRKIECRCLFSTHLHLLCDEFSNDSRVSPYHMDLDLNNDTKTITFLYKFIPGICPKSYGMNVANLAGIPQEIIDNSVNLASDAETCTLLLRNISEIKKFIRKCLPNWDNNIELFEFFKNNKNLIKKFIDELP